MRTALWLRDTVESSYFPFSGLVIYQILTWVKLGKEHAFGAISAQDVFSNML